MLRLSGCVGMSTWSHVSVCGVGKCGVCGFVGVSAISGMSVCGRGDCGVCGSMVCLHGVL